MKITTALQVAGCALILLAPSAQFAAAQDKCCKVVKIDNKKGIVTATDKVSRSTFQFPAHKEALKTLRVGAHIDASYARQATADAGFWPWPPRPRCPCGKDAGGKCWCPTSDCLPPEGRWGCHVTVQPGGPVGSMGPGGSTNPP